MKLPEGHVAGVAPKKATAMGGIGQKMLEKMGWSKGDGLGKEKQGRASHIEVAKKDDKSGLGGKYSWDWAENYASAAFEGAMSKFKTDSASSSDSGDSSDSSSDDEDFVNRDGTAASASASELKLMRELAKDNNLGRFGARQGKLDRVRDQETKLVGSVKPVGAAANASKKRPRQDASTADDAQVKRKLIVIEVKVKGLEDLSQPTAPPPPRPEGWWGQSTFASAGWLGGINEDESTKKRQEFTEDTQESIFYKLKEQEANVRPHFMPQTVILS